MLLSRKKDHEGIKERENILKRYLPDVRWPDFYEKAAEFRCQPDDIADAASLCIAAALKEQGKCETIPEQLEKDERDLYMKMTVPKKEVACYNTAYTITRRSGRIDWSEIPVLKIDQVLWLPDAGIRAEGQ